MYKLLKYFLPYILNYKKEYGIALTGTVIIAIATTLTAYILKPLLDNIFIEKDYINYYFIPFLIILIFTLRACGRFLQDYYMAYIAERIVNKLRNKVVKYLTLQDLEYLHKKENGDLLSRVFSDLDRIKNTISAYFPSIMSSFVTIIFLTSYLLYQSFTLTLYFFMIIIISIIPFNIFNKKMRRYSIKAQEQTSILISKIIEIFNNIELIKSTSSENYEYKQFVKENEEYLYFNMKQKKINSTVSPVVEIISSIGIAFVLFLGMKEVLNGDITTGVFFSFVFGIFLLYDPIKTLLKLLNQIQDIMVATERFNIIFKVKPKIISGNKLIKSINSLELKNIFFGYDSTLILKDINFKLEKGKIYALIGESGSGKTTLINLIMRLYEYKKGDILINDIDIKYYNIESLHNKISFVMQKSLILQDTILSNITYDLDIDKNKAIESLKKAQALDFVNKLKNGIDTVLYEFGANLSGGEKQRIILARAFYRDSNLIILDEATSALDKDNNFFIQKILNNLKKNMIILIITHQTDILKYVDKVFKLEGGKIN